MTYCVSCRAESDQKRCKPCFLAWVRGGKNVRHDNVHTSPSGIRTCNIQFESKAPVKYCHWCGGLIDQKSVRDAMLANMECHTCAACSWARRTGVVLGK